MHGFLKEIGQGLQHLAARVITRARGLVGFVERVNNDRKITASGFSFLRIPRSYYGRLDARHLADNGVSEKLPKEILTKLEAAELMTASGVVDIAIKDEQIHTLNFAGQLSRTSPRPYARLSSRHATKTWPDGVHVEAPHSVAILSSPRPSMKSFVTLRRSVPMLPLTPLTERIGAVYQSKTVRILFFGYMGLWLLYAPQRPFSSMPTLP